MVYLGVCHVLRTAPLDFCATDLFPSTLNDFCFMVFAEVFMKDLARVLLIHVRLLTMHFEHSCNEVTFRMPFSKKTAITVTEVVFLQVSL